MSTLTVHWTSRQLKESGPFMASWRVETIPRLDVVNCENSLDVVHETFSRIRTMLRRLVATIDEADGGDKYMRHVLAEPETAAQFASSEAYRLAQEHPWMYVNENQDAAPKTSTFDALCPPGIIITPEVTSSGVEYRLRSGSGADWWSTPLPEVQGRRAEKELIAAEYLHPLLRGHLDTWEGHASGRSDLSGPEVTNEPAIHDLLENLAVTAMTQFDIVHNPTTTSATLAVRLRYDRPPRSKPVPGGSGDPNVANPRGTPLDDSSVAFRALSPPRHPDWGSKNESRALLAWQRHRASSCPTQHPEPSSPGHHRSYTGTRKDTLTRLAEYRGTQRATGSKRISGFAIGVSRTDSERDRSPPSVADSRMYDGPQIPVEPAQDGRIPSASGEEEEDQGGFAQAPARSHDGSDDGDRPIEIIQSTEAENKSRKAPPLGNEEGHDTDTEVATQSPLDKGIRIGSVQESTIISGASDSDDRADRGNGAAARSFAAVMSVSTEEQKTKANSSGGRQGWTVLSRRKM